MLGTAVRGVITQKLTTRNLAGVCEPHTLTRTTRPEQCHGPPTVQHVSEYPLRLSKEDATVGAAGGEQV
jgi:hypothetical protein